MSNRDLWVELQALPKVNLSDPKLRGTPTYLSAPYFSPDRAVVKQRVQACQAAAWELLKRGIPAFSPCTYTAQWQGEDLAADFTPAGGWYALDLAFLRGCHVLIVLMLAGVENSRGVAMEFDYAQQSGMPVYRLEIADLVSA